MVTRVQGHPSFMATRDQGHTTPPTYVPPDDLPWLVLVLLVDVMFQLYHRALHTLGLPRHIHGNHAGQHSVQRSPGFKPGVTVLLRSSLRLLLYSYSFSLIL